MKNLYIVIVLLFVFFVPLIKGQTPFTELNLKGKEALKSKNNEAAEKFFYQSIMQNKDADSYYQWAKLNKDKNDYHVRNLAYEYISQATLLEPDNLKIKYLYLDYLEDFGKLGKREDEYRNIIATHPNEVKALFKLAEYKLKIYEKFKDAKIQTQNWGWDEEVFPDDMGKEVKNDIDSAEYFYLQGLKIDSLNYDGLFGIVNMYQRIIKPEKAIEYLEKIKKYYPDDKDVHLQLGVYYYKKRKLDESFKELQKGLNLMGAEEKEDFVYNSVITILEPKYFEPFKTMSKEEKKAFINKWWKALDPLYLTDYNERLIEHYARVAYANLFFSVPRIDLIGWKSDRGQVLIRYGEPRKKLRIRQDDPELMDRYMEFWEYDNLPGFCFSGSTNYFKFVQNYTSENIWIQNKIIFRGREHFEQPSVPGNRFTINSLRDYESVKRQKIQFYQPVLYGNKINLDFKTYSFDKLSGKDNGNIETYVAYSIPTKDTTYKNDVNDYTHEIGVYFFDQNFDPIAQLRKTVQDSEIKKVFSPGKDIPINCIGLGEKPGKVSFAFDLRRSIDSNYFTYRKMLEIPMIERSVLGMSDLIFSKNIELEKELPMGIKRGDISFYPNLNGKFKNGDKFYIYYEVYNLKLDESKEGQYEQVITIKPKGEEGLSLKKIIKGITTLFTGEEGKVSLTSNYKTNEENTQVYMQLDISGYKTGKYDLLIRINDKMSGKSTEKKVDLEII